MGIGTISLDWTVEGTPEWEPILAAVVRLPTETLRRMHSESQHLAAYETLGEVRVAVGRGADEYREIMEGTHRYVTGQQIRDELWHYVAGGASWGSDPFPGFSDLWAFLDACNYDPDLREASGFVSWGIMADTAKESTIIDMFAIAMAAESIPADKSTRIINRVAEALGVR